MDLETKLQNAIDEIDQLENRLCRNNLRIINFPEDIEKYNMTTYLVSRIAAKFAIQLEESDIESAHRIRRKDKAATFPRMTVFKLHHFQKKVEILKALRSAAELCIQDRTVRIVPDLSSRLRKHRGAFRPLRNQLDKIGIKSQVRHPATLWIWDGNYLRQFETPQEATESLKSKYPDIV
ncbi:hypothetical protein EOD39_13935 [Acipenser ruthenus]|uniref:LINE-1 type transposase domain-containing protein 1 n=1 Tax=Acipenser ruthenus TaxID=7906 RepID=A0A662YQT8_ACIRT|nr:hypothetical protein EOD39_13935 [Acipenser ruthenus]